MQKGTYSGSSVAELGDVDLGRRLIGLVDQRKLFAHHGDIALGADHLVLEGWHELTPGQVAAVRQEFIPQYNRFAAGGSRGSFPSFGFFRKAGAPVIIDLVSGDSIALIIDFHVISGTTENTEWLPLLREFARQG